MKIYQKFEKKLKAKIKNHQSFRKIGNQKNFKKL